MDSTLQRRNWATTGQRNRCTACLGITYDSAVNVLALELALRRICWEDRALEWHDAMLTNTTGCGFISGDMYAEFSDSSQTDLPDALYLNHESSKSPRHAASLKICCSLLSADVEPRKILAESLLDQIGRHCENTKDILVQSIRVLLVSQAARIPLMSLENGLNSLHVPVQNLKDRDGVDLAIAHLDKAGIFTIIEPIASSEDVACLRKLVVERVRDAEDALRLENEDIGSGDVSYAEICSRGKLRWDLLLHAGGERQGSGDVNSDANFEVLERIATEGAWVPVMHAVLGEFKWQASVICSRPGAPAGKWHTDGGHSNHVFNGESGPAYAICVFIPLVNLQKPHQCDSGSTRHGFGCTAFWPGSHRYEQCAHLGAAAAERLGVVVPGAPMEPGTALIYDYRVVHCASPNDAFDFDDGERPILQLTYSFYKYNDVQRNYGYYQLFTE